MDTRICEKCGKPLRENAIFCGNCGHCSAHTTSVKNPQKKSTFPSLLVPENATAENLISRAILELEFGDFAKADDYCEYALNLDSKNAKVYYIKLLIECKVTSGEKLALLDKSFEDSRNYVLATRYGDEALKTELAGYLSTIKQRADAQYKSYAYNRACSLLMLDDKAPIAEAIKLFDSIGDYRDSYEKVVLATRKLEDAETVNKITTKLKKEDHDRTVAEKERVKAENKQKITARIDNTCDFFKSLFPKFWNFISGYLLIFIALCLLVILCIPLVKWYKAEQINSEKYSKAENYLSESKYYMAFKIFNELGNYSDSEEKCSMLKQEYPEEMLKQELELKGFLTEFAQKFDMVACLPGEFNRNNTRIINKTIFYIGKYPVTQQFYLKITGKSPSLFKGEDRPVETVNWYAANEFCQLLNEATKKTRPADYVFDLPTEAQWEYACRAGTDSDFNNGKSVYEVAANSSLFEEIGWYADNSKSRTHNVGLKKPNQWGIYDMHGNVWEWCKDWYGDYPALNEMDASYFQENGTTKVCRGGSWISNPDSCTSSYRMQAETEYERRTLGFRIVLVPVILKLD